MKTKFLKLLSLCMVVVFVFSFAACKNDDAANTSGDNASKSGTVQSNDAPATTDNTAQQGSSNSSQETPGKYADAEIYEKDGKKYSKTEGGTEVEMSGENLQDLMGEYTKVQGTGSEKEKELLDKIQVILDNVDRIANQ